MHISSTTPAIPTQLPSPDKHVPNGLSGRGGLPPGIAKKLEDGGTAPPGILKRFPAATPTPPAADSPPDSGVQLNITVLATTITVDVLA